MPAITEPLTMLTDYGLAAESMWCGAMLLSLKASQPHRGIRFWAAAFGCVALAALSGGTFHGFFNFLSNQTRSVLWQTTLYAIGAAGLMMLLATFDPIVQSAWRRRCMTAAGIKFGLYALWIATFPRFAYAAIDYLLVMAIVLGVHLNRSQPSSRWIRAGIGVSMVAIGIQAISTAIGGVPYTAIYHLVQMVALYLFYRGATQLA